MITSSLQASLVFNPIMISLTSKKRRWMKTLAWSRALIGMLSVHGELSRRNIMSLSSPVSVALSSHLDRLRGVEHSMLMTSSLCCFRVHPGLLKIAISSVIRYTRVYYVSMTSHHPFMLLLYPFYFNCQDIRYWFLHRPIRDLGVHFRVTNKLLTGFITTYPWYLFVSVDRREHVVVDIYPLLC